MNKGTLIGAVCGALAVSALWTGAHTFAQEGADGMSPEAMMKAWEAASTPGKQHTQIGKLAGEWKVVSEFTMAPEAPPEVSEGTQSSEMIYGGRYLKSTYNSDFMGEPFTGTSLMGYDNVTKKFNSFWIDSMSTGMFLASGEWSDADKAWTFQGEMTDPMSGQMVKTKHVLAVQDNDHYTLDMYRSTPDGMVHEGNIKYTRVK